MTYDSRPETLDHIDTVQNLMAVVLGDLASRAAVHDRSKLGEPEKSVFDRFTPRLRQTTYGSPEYKGYLEGMGEGLRVHYAANDHHPEHFENGIADMDLVQVIEMAMDWAAAVTRHDDGDLARSVEVNQERFGYDDGIKQLLLNTYRNMGLIDAPR